MIHYHQVLVSKNCGGAYRMAREIVRFLRNHGLPVYTWIPGEGPARQEAQSSGLEIRTYDPTPAFGASKIGAARANAKMWRALSRLRPGLIHIHGPLHYGALRFAVNLSGLKSIVHVHIETDDASLCWAFQRPPDLILTCADFLVEQVRRALPERYRERQPIVALPNAVDTATFHPGDKRASKRLVGAPAGTPLALVVANLAPHKGQETAIRAAALLKQRGVDIACWLAGTERGGEGRYTRRLESLIAELDVGDRVRLLGQRDDVPDLLRAADFFLLPSRHEGLPLSVLEAQATNVPVLAAATAGIPEVVRDGETGFQIPAQDVVGYGACIQNLLDKPELVHRVTEAAYARVVREYNLQTFCLRTWNLYQALLEGDVDLQRREKLGPGRQLSGFLGCLPQPVRRPFWSRLRLRTPRH